MAGEIYRHIWYGQSHYLALTWEFYVWHVCSNEEWILFGAYNIGKRRLKFTEEIFYHRWPQRIFWSISRWRHLWPSGTWSCVPETGMKTKYIFLFINPTITHLVSGSSLLTAHSLVPHAIAQQGLSPHPSPSLTSYAGHHQAQTPLSPIQALTLHTQLPLSPSTHRCPPIFAPALRPHTKPLWTHSPSSLGSDKLYWEGCSPHHTWVLTFCAGLRAHTPVVQK